MNAVRISRRKFLSLLGAAVAALAVPSAVSYAWMQATDGVYPPQLDPYDAETPADSPEPAQILLVVNPDTVPNFGMYLAEVLRAEGINGFSITTTGHVSLEMLRRYDIVIVSAGPLTAQIAAALESYVLGGGRLLAIRPDPRVAGLFGLKQASTTLSEGYIQVNPAHPAAAGIVAESLQFHGQADLYQVVDAEVCAWLDQTSQVTTTHPAVVFSKRRNGFSACFAYDLPRSIALMRQGNPAWANQERDGLDAIRATDMFAGWIDLQKLSIPQADEQQRLLVNLISLLSEGRTPVPRFWYFPGEAKTVFVATSDAHQNSGAAVEKIYAGVERYGGRLSVYYLPPFLDEDELRLFLQRIRWVTSDLKILRQAYFPSPSQVEAWRKRGHEFSLHPEVKDGLEAYWRRYWKAFTAMNYGPITETTRTHYVLWTGWVETARLQASFGLRMNFDYYHTGPMFRDSGGNWLFGHFTGSGLPMKFVDEQGRVLNLYQQLTHLADDHMIVEQWGSIAYLSPEAATDVSRELMQHSLQGGYAAITAIFHTDPFDAGGQAEENLSAWLDGTLSFAQTQNIPILSGEEWCKFSDGRRKSAIRNVAWDSSGQRFSANIGVAVPAGSVLTLMLPAQQRTTKLTRLVVDGEIVQTWTQRLGAVEYICAGLTPGDHTLKATYQT
jgi:hypothetical protein